MSQVTGHLFVVHGKISSVVHDAALVPVDQAYRFTPAWQDLVDENPPLPLRWHERGYGRIKPAPDRVWAVSINGPGGDDYDAILDRIEGALERINLRREVRAVASPRRPLPLVAVPVMGIGDGGHTGDRGTVVRKLVTRLHEVAQRKQLDIVLVSPDPAVYAAAQYARRSLDQRLPSRLEDVAMRLGRLAQQGELALLLGAGIGMPVGLPSWDGLISQLAALTGVDEPSVKDGLSATDRAELIERDTGRDFQDNVASIFKRASYPSLLHALLAGLDCRQVVTTNYDTLYEKAVEATGRGIASVMPWQSAQGASRWILKLHGDADNPSTIVLTRRHMLQYDAANRPSSAMLQSLLLTRHLLAVGVSMTDDNVIRLAHEVQAYRQEHQGGGTDVFGTVLDVRGDALRRRLWEGQLDWVELPDHVPDRDGARAVELLLDRVAFHAARDSSWLLDQRFEGLLDPEERRVAEVVRRAYREIPRRKGNKWWPLVKELERLGASYRDRG